MTKQEILAKMLIKPKELELKDGVFKKDATAPISTNIDKDFSYLLSLAGFTTAAKTTWFDLDNTYIITIGDVDAIPEIPDFFDDEEYFMDITADSIVIASSTVGGALLGLKAYIRMESELEVMPQMTISDYPNIPFRAVHTCVFRPDDGTEKEESHPDYIKKMMKTAAISGYNHIFIEFWGMFPYSLDYAHWPTAYTKAEIACVLLNGIGIICNVALLIFCKC